MSDAALSPSLPVPPQPWLYSERFLAAEQEKGLYAGYDPDVAFAALEARMAKGESFPLTLVE